MLVDAYIGYKRGGSELRGISGFRRAIIALTVILILGISVFHLLANNTDSNSKPVVSNILSMLAGLVSAIAGFYFGGRFTEKRAEEGEKRARKAEDRAKKAEEMLKKKYRDKEIRAKSFKFDWEGGLSELREKFTSVELQHRALEWR